MDAHTDRPDKEALRTSCRAIRMALSDERRARFSEQICFHLSGSKVFKDARSIHAFWPMVERGEVDLRPLLLDAHSKDRDIWLPIVSGHMLQHGLFSGEDQLTKASFGQKEPSGTKRENLVVPDLVIVPGLAVDPTGNRLGYGGGFYDRFLSELSASAKRCPFVMVLFEDQVLDSVPHFPHDVPIDAFVTETGMTWCNPQRQSV